MSARTSDNDPAPSSRLLSTADASRELRCSRRSIWRLLSLGQLARVQIGRAVRITRESVEAFIERGGAR